MPRFTFVFDGRILGAIGKTERLQERIYADTLEDALHVLRNEYQDVRIHKVFVLYR